jgi:pimeloyl-ACP methyl ester carboxylesterase
MSTAHTPMPNKASTRVALDDGRTVRVVTGGVQTGKPAVLFNAALGTPLESWSLVAPAVAERTRVVLWDRPGIGGSDGGAPLDLNGVVDAIARVLAPAAGPVVAVGHSIGGLHALCLGAARPDLVAGVVLVDPSHPDQGTRLPASGDGLLRAAKLVAATPEVVRRAPAVGLQLLSRALRSRVRRGTRLMAELAPSMAARLGDLVAEEQATNALFDDARRLLAASAYPAIPLVVLTATRNFKDPAAQATWEGLHRELVALSPLGELVKVDSGHDLPFARPDVVEDAITRVLGPFT